MIEFDLNINVLKAMIIMGRTLGIIAALPVFSVSIIPRKIQVLFGLSITVLIYQLAPDQWFPAIGPTSGSLIILALFMLSEFIFGALIGLLFRIIHETFSMCGQMIDTMMGFAMASEVDPTLEQQVTLTGILLNRTFLIILLISGAHITIFKILRDSFMIQPMRFVIQQPTADIFMNLMSDLFRVGVQLAMPVICVTFLINVALGLMTKFGEEFQVLMISFPIRIGAGLAFFLASLPYIIPKAGQMIDQVLEHINTLALQ